MQSLIGLARVAAGHATAGMRTPTKTVNGKGAAGIIVPSFGAAHVGQPSQLEEYGHGRRCEQSRSAIGDTQQLLSGIPTGT